MAVRVTFCIPIPAERDISSFYQYIRSIVTQEILAIAARATGGQSGEDPSALHCVQNPALCERNRVGAGV
jgi:hypothetical protein